MATGDGAKGKVLCGDKGKKPLKGETSLLMTTANLKKDVGENDPETPFVKMSLPKGAFGGIVGHVGSGKV